jgi:xylan 1,4-beta-xylosidase
MKPLSSPLLALASVLAPNGVAAFQFPDCTQKPLVNTTVCNTKASPPDRAAALVKMMNITEKLSNLVEYVLFTQYNYGT